MRCFSSLVISLLFLPFALHADDSQILKIYFRADCAPCVQEMKIVPEIAKEHDDLAIKIITLNHKKPSIQFPPNVDIIDADDKENEHLKALNGSFALPFSVFISSDGAICGKHYGILGTEQVDKWTSGC